MGLKTNYGSVLGGVSNGSANKKDRGGIPGPGQYQQTGIQKSIAYSFGVKTGSALDKK
jgi:hypothetical protein